MIPIFIIFFITFIVLISSVTTIGLYYTLNDGTTIKDTSERLGVSITYNPVGPYDIDTFTGMSIIATFTKPISDIPKPKILITGDDNLASTEMTKTSDTVYYYTHTITANTGGTADVFILEYEDLEGNKGPAVPWEGGTYELTKTEPFNIQWGSVGQNGNFGFNYGNILYSNDGVSWLESNNQGASLARGYGIAYGLSSDNNSPMWVAVGVDSSFGGKILYSNDGVSWLESNNQGASFSSLANSAFFGVSSNGTSPMWVAVGSDGTNPDRGHIIYSQDGITWHDSDDRGASFSGRGNDVAFGVSSNGTTPMWVAVGSENPTGSNPKGNIMYSSDGITWLESSGTGASMFSYVNGIAFGVSSNGTSPMWVAVGSDGANPDRGHIIYSHDGITWHDSNGQGASFLTQGNKVAFGVSSNGTSPMWVAVGNNGTGTDEGNILYSHDGITWLESQGASFSFQGNNIYFGVSSDGSTPMWVAAGSDDTTAGNILYSHDGITWLESSGTGDTFASFGNGITNNYRNPVWDMISFDYPVQN